MYKITLMGLLVGLSMITGCLKQQSRECEKPLMKIDHYNDIVHLFPKKPDQINEQVERYMHAVQDELNKIIAVGDDARTWDTVMRPLDNLMQLSDGAIMASILSVIEHVSPDDSLRAAAHAAVLKIHEQFVDLVGLNVELYHVIKSYAEGNAQKESLSHEQRYFLQETIDDYKRHGLDLPAEKQEKIRTLLKEIFALELLFEENISRDNRTVVVTYEELAGLEQEFIAHLKRSEHGDYILGVDYPTYFSVRENCTIESTRKKLYLAFNSRAYPANESVLSDVIEKRDQLAKLLGFASYAHLDLDDAMAKTPERVEEFLQALSSKAHIKELQEFDALKNSLPEGVQLTPDGKCNPWDYAYIAHQYKKKYLAVDEDLIAEYFSMDSAIKGMLSIYEQFLGISFKEYPAEGLWAEDLRLVEVYDTASSSLLGYLLLDLFPRPNKFSHACHMSIVPAVDPGDGTFPPSLSLVIANFTKPTADKPALLHRERDVETFFHEFGHALHALLGRTRIASQSGTHVKTDFVEMPSQMLEEWLWDASILKKISRHYKTGEPLPNDMIVKIQKLKHFDTGFFVQRQVMLARLSLACYLPGEKKNVAELSKKIHLMSIVSTPYEPASHMYASFGHLMGYGAKYYGYLWSKVFAIDLFEQIKKEGLLNQRMGKKYLHEVLAKGGSQDPNDIIKNFLGREPNERAFLKDMGLQ